MSRGSVPSASTPGQVLGGASEPSGDVDWDWLDIYLTPDQTRPLLVRGMSREEILAALARVPDAARTPGSVSLFLRQLTLWIDLLGEPDLTRREQMAGVLRQWIRIGEADLLRDQGRSALVPCAPLLLSMLTPAWDGGRSIESLLDRRRSRLRGQVLHGVYQEQVRSAHQRWRWLLSPYRYGWLYLDLAYAGISLTEATDTVRPRLTDDGFGEGPRSPVVD